MYIKGDIPFLVSKDSADVWMNRQLFKLHCNAGAPPDMYSANGQDWGLPTYNWPAMEKDGYKWWKVNHVTNFYQIYSNKIIFCLGSLSCRTTIFPFISHRPYCWIFPHLVST